MHAKLSIRRIGFRKRDRNITEGRSVHVGMDPWASIGRAPGVLGVVTTIGIGCDSMDCSLHSLNFSPLEMLALDPSTKARWRTIR